MVRSKKWHDEVKQERKRPNYKQKIKFRKINYTASRPTSHTISEFSRTYSTRYLQIHQLKKQRNREKNIGVFLTKKGMGKQPPKSISIYQECVRARQHY